MTEKLSFAWWNTGLSPLAKSRASDAERDIAIQVIRHLLFTEKVDFLALSEISFEDVFAFEQSPELKNYEIKSGVLKKGRITFDTCFIYNANKIAVIDIIDKIEGISKKMRLAQKLTLQVAISKQPFHVFISHWSSRLYCPADDADRDLLGIRLRDDVDAILSRNSEEFIILLGDYNDEPFDKSLARQLRATRDKALVKRKPNLIYNPFWQHLTYPDTDLNYAGTYYHKGGDITKWRTFDQIMFSSAFLTSELQLNEAQTGIVHIPDYLKQVKNSNSIFDHLPVKTIIEKVQ